jgi:DNA topoisomerase-1
VWDTYNIESISEVILAKLQQLKYLDRNGIPEPPYALVVCEKPSVAMRIAQALGTSSFAKITGLDKDLGPVEKRRGRFQSTAFLAISQNARTFVVCSALGHLYGLVDVNRDRTVYPVFDVKWTPILRKSGRKGQSTALAYEQIIKSISSLSQKATSYIHACDYDQEGEVIGYNILEYACKNKYERSLRAKYSALTDQEIRNSFDNLLPPDKRLAEAGRSRHLVDFIFGVNLSRALTEAFKNSNNRKKYYNLSIGRVQGPTLAFVVDKELIIRNHIPIPYWSINAEFEKDGHIINTHYYRQRIETLSESTSILRACSSQKGKVTKIKNQRNTLCAPHPFNLADLQKEAFRVFRFSPSYTLSIAEKLYITALISYPRTSSQKIPSSINYRNIISELSRITSSSVPGHRANSSRWSNGVPMSGPYTKITMNLLSNSNNLTPNEGVKTDPAHPAIYPTGENPRGNLNANEFKLFDLIVRRFLATFGQPAISQHTLVTIFVIDEHFFEADAKTMIDEGWMLFYKPYISSSLGLGSQSYLRNLHEGDMLKNDVVTTTNKFTQPPTRFNQSSLLEEMESKKIGTKATRSEIISTLFKRGYVSNVRSSKDARQYDRFEGGIEPTDLGVEIVQSMRQYIPNIVSIALTRAMDELLESIALGNDKSDFAIKYAKAKLKEAIIPFKENETEIGNRITDAINATKDRQQLVLGTCPVCGRGTLKIIRSGKTKKRFVGCSNYTSGTCKATVPLPQNGSIRPTGENCTSCRWPVLENTYFHGAKYRWKFCININCPSKKK